MTINKHLIWGAAFVTVGLVVAISLVALNPTVQTLRRENMALQRALVQKDSTLRRLAERVPATPEAQKAQAAKEELEIERLYHVPNSYTLCVFSGRGFPVFHVTRHKLVHTEVGVPYKLEVTYGPGLKGEFILENYKGLAQRVHGDGC